MSAELGYRRVGAFVILEALKKRTEPKWLEALACLPEHPHTYAIKLSLEKLYAIHPYLPVLLTRYHLKIKGKYINVQLVAEVNAQWEAL